MSTSRETMFAELRDVLVEKLRIPPEEITPAVSGLHLGLDSLAVVELSTALHKRCGVRVPAQDLFAATNLMDIVDLLQARTAATR
ncbi:acyl carrier protein [Embleya sp. AB8]|uniref:acyl carrier protein n=1 Tax=Embleya sp. AB8 TaxID=3156304 RepID=UPI003C711EBA